MDRKIRPPGHSRFRRLRCEILEERMLLSVVPGEPSGLDFLSACTSAEQIAVSLSCPAYSLELQSEGDDRIVALDLPSTTEAGAPDLPGRLLRFALPMDTDLASVRLEDVSGEARSISGQYRLGPALAPVTDAPDGELVAGIGAPLVDGKDLSVYTADAMYDAAWCTFVSAQQMGRWKIAEVYYSPFAYNPVAQTLEVVDAAAFRLSFTGGDPLPAALANRTTWDAEAAGLVANFDEAAAWYGESKSPTDGSAATSGVAEYVIITTAAVQTNSTQLANFVADKQAHGFTVAVKTEADWGGGTGNTAADNIRNWLAANYAVLGIRYVLLIGDPNPATGGVPMKMTYPRSGAGSYEDSPTDYYYADLTSNWDTDGDGKYGEWSSDISSKPLHEVLVGRIPVYNAVYSTLDSVLAKTIAYNNATDIAWRENILLPMAVSNYANEDGSGRPRCDGHSLGEAIKTNLADPRSYGTWRLYEQAGLTPVTAACEAPLTSTNVVSRWAANPYGIVAWWGHGSATGAYRKYWHSDDDSDGVPDDGEMYKPSFFTSSNTTSLDDAHPSVVFQVSCNNGDPGYTTNLGYSLLKQGAIGTYSASRVSWYAVTNWSPSLGTTYGDNASYAYYGTKRLVENPATETTGAALQWCRENLGTSWGNSSWMNCTDFNLYGDPAILPFLSGAAEANLDADGDGVAEPLTDGILILRYLFDPSGSWQVSDALGSGATRNTAADVAAYLDQGGLALLDADGNGAAEPLTDGILILRFLFDPAGQWPVDDALGTGATRTAREDIRAFLEPLRPSLPPAPTASEPDDTPPASLAGQVARSLPETPAEPLAVARNEAAEPSALPPDALQTRSLDLLFQDWSPSAIMRPSVAPEMDAGEGCSADEPLRQDDLLDSQPVFSEWVHHF